MTWGTPLALVLLVLPAAAVVLFVREASQRRQKLERLGASHLVDALIKHFDERAFWRVRILFALAAVAAVVSLAGPKWGAQTEVLPRRGLDVVFALDVSQSMRARDVRPDRLERAKAEIGRLLPTLSENRIGLVAFAGTAFIQCPLTTDAEAVRTFMAGLDPSVIPQGGTALGLGLERAASVFDAEERSAGRVLVVVSDGEDHEGGYEEAAKHLSALGVQVFLIGIGSGLGEPVPVVDDEGRVTDYLKDRRGQTVMTRMSPEVLSEVAATTKGVFIDGTTDPSLGMDQVVTAITTLEKRDLEARVRTTFTDRSMWFSGLAALLIAAGLVLRRRQENGRPA